MPPHKKILIFRSKVMHYSSKGVWGKKFLFLEVQETIAAQTFGHFLDIPNQMNEILNKPVQFPTNPRP